MQLFRIEEQYKDFKQAVEDVFARIQQELDSTLKIEEQQSMKEIKIIELPEIPKISMDLKIGLIDSDFLLNKLHKNNEVPGNQKVQCKKKTEQLNTFIWDDENDRFIRMKVDVQLTQDQQIKYIKDGSLLRTQSVSSYLVIKQRLIPRNQNCQQIWNKQNFCNGLENMAQTIKNKDSGEHRGKEILYQELVECISDGKKEGRWKDISKNYWTEAQVYETGEYKNGVRKGPWKFIYDNKELGGGKYNDLGLRCGKWIELSEYFFYNAQVTYDGEYNMKGRKIGKWNISAWEQLIAGGSYGKGEDQIKIGQWLELWEGFEYNSQVIYKGEYNMRGIKVGRWDILFERQQIGGGSYVEREGQLKIGQWTELWEGFRDLAQVIYDGEYNMKGMKEGRWNIGYCNKKGNGKYKKIGGGQYGNGEVKIGRWVDLWENFGHKSQVTYNGEYNMEGRRIGRWDILFEGQQIGGGQYSIGTSQIKIKEWVELDEGFEWDKYVTYNGKYNTKGKKVGRWNILFLEQQIGGGYYFEAEDTVKIGRWVELWEKFCDRAQVTYSGQYNIKGMKVGRWSIGYCDKQGDGKYKKIGGGSYGEDEGQIKIGRWIELWEEFQDRAQVTYSGQYNMKGRKVGRWEIYCSYKEQKYKLIGGGQYSEGDVKIGRWVELWENFGIDSQITYNGEYNKVGMKIGKWVKINIEKNEIYDEIKYQI